MEENSTTKQPSEHNHIQKILHKTKIFGLVLLIIELIAIIAGGFLYMSAHHPYFTRNILPDFFISFLSFWSAIILSPIIFAGPVVFILTILAGLVAIFCLIVSIYQFRKWLNLKLPKQNYKIAICSIVFNALSIIPIIALVIILITAYLT